MFFEAVLRQISSKPNSFSQQIRFWTVQSFFATDHGTIWRKSASKKIMLERSDANQLEHNLFWNNLTRNKFQNYLFQECLTQNGSTRKNTTIPFWNNMTHISFKNIHFRKIWRKSAPKWFMLEQSDAHKFKNIKKKHTKWPQRNTVAISFRNKLTQISFKQCYFRKV